MRGEARPAVIVGYDGSPGAASAIEVGARLLPTLVASVAYVWLPPFASRELRRRLWRSAEGLEDLMRSIEREGAAEAERVAAEGVAVARAAGWDAQPLAQRSYAGEGFELARLAGQRKPALLVVGARGLSGARAVLGSVSDLVVHHSPVPVLVIPQPTSKAYLDAAATGPVLVAYDGSDGARSAVAVAASLFAGRALTAVTVGRDDAAALPSELDVELMRVTPVGVADAARAVGDALAHSAADRGAAVIAVGSRGRSAAREILLGSVAMAVLHHAQRPVLVVPTTTAPDR